EIKNVDVVIDYAFREANGEPFIDPWNGTKVPFDKATPTYRNITIRDVKAVNAEEAISFLGWPLANVENVILEDVSIEAENGAVFQYIDNLLLKNVKIKTTGESIKFIETPNKIIAQ